MSDTLRWGILGAAKFAKEHMGPAIQMARGGALCAIATRDPAKAAAFAEFAPGLRVHSDYQALLDDPEIDAVYIPLPNSLHVEWARRAATAGKHVLCEKPIAMQAGEIDDLIALRDSSGLLIAEAYMIVHHPQWQRVRHLLAEGAIGTLRHIQGYFSFEPPADSNIRMQNDLGGGGLRDIGVYTFGSARFATGLEPSDVAARVSFQNGVDTHAVIWANFGQASYAAMVSMQLFRAQEMLFHGDKGMIRVTVPFNAGVIGEAQVELHQPDGSIRIDRYPTAQQYVLQVEAFNTSVSTGAPYACPLEFTRGTQAMIDRVFEVAERSE